jgi:peptidoglycan/LPS O-acetylase OafA/YrhL
MHRGLPLTPMDQATPALAPAGIDMAEGRRNLDIEVLRGISILLVMVSHVYGLLITADVPALGHFGTYYFKFWPGVDLFFAISGFVIARTLIPVLREAKSKNAYARAVLAFLIRRAWRLLPSSWLWLSLILVAAAIFNRGGYFGLFHDNFESVLAAFMSLANVHFAVAFGHFGIGASAAYWSLSLEEQFYLALPVIVFFAGRRLVPVLLIILGIVLVWPEADGWIGLFRIQAVVLGVLLAEFSWQPSYGLAEPHVLGRSRIARFVCLVLPISLMAALAADKQQITPHHFDAIAVLAILPVFVASYGRGYILTGGALKRILVWFGARSYALYVMHTPLFCATHEVFARASGGTWYDSHVSPLFIATGVSATLLLAELNYRWVERPLRRHGRRIALRYGEAEGAVLINRQASAAKQD